MSNETWKDYYYKHFKQGTHDVPRKAVEATYNYQQVKIDNLTTQLTDAISSNEELRVREGDFKHQIESLLEAISWYQLFLAPGGKKYMLDKAEEKIKASGINLKNS